jgi:hypothetical protein
MRCKDVKDRKACMQDPRVAGVSEVKIRTAQRHFVTSFRSSSPYKDLDVPKVVGDQGALASCKLKNKGRVRIGVRLLGIELNLGVDGKSASASRLRLRLRLQVMTV